MTPSKTRLFFLILITTLLGACKKEVSKNIDQDKIWTSFELYYDQNEDRTYATAEFHFSSEIGTLLKLSDPSSVTLDGANMEWDPESSIYELEFSGFKPSGEFVWVDLDGNMFTNTVDIRVIDFPSELDSLHYSDSVSYFIWEGMALDSFETAILEIDGTGNSDTRRFSVDSLNATTITIDAFTLSQVQSDTSGNRMVDIRLQRNFSPEISESPSKGGKLSGVYQPINQQVTLTE